MLGRMDEGRKRVLGIIAGILVARHLKTTEDLFDTRDRPRTGAWSLLPFSGLSGLWEKWMRSAESKAKNIGITSSGPVSLPELCHLMKIQ